MRRTEFSKGSIKRLKKQSLRKDTDSRESKRSVITQETGDKKRIKQKLLSAIFAKKLKEANPVILNIQQSQIPSQSKSVTAKVAESKKIVCSDTTNVKSDKIRSNSDFTNEPTVSFAKTTKGLAKKKDNSKHESKKFSSDKFLSQLKNCNKSDTLNLTQEHDISKSNFKSDKESKVVAKESPILKSNKIPSTQNYDSTDEPTVSFTKATKEHIGKTLLAKKKDKSKGESKKSLSDIFSSQLKNQNESDILNLTQKHDIPKDNFKPDKQNKVIGDDSPVLKNTKETDILNKKRERKERNKKRNLNKDWNSQSDKTPKLMGKGKISSLFGNNPDVPTIGQRFVKPVNETVFTEITFADLNIHPFMVSICLLLTFTTKTFITFIPLVTDIKFRAKYGYN